MYSSSSSSSLNSHNHHRRLQAPSFASATMSGDCRLDMSGPPPAPAQPPLSPLPQPTTSQTLDLPPQVVAHQQQTATTSLLDANTAVELTTTTNGDNNEETLHVNIGAPGGGGPRTQARIDVNPDHVQQLVTVLKENLTSTLPFLLILVIKAFYDHSAGLASLVFFSASIYHANTVLVEQAAAKSNRRILPVLRVILILGTSLGLFLYLFRNEKFLNSLLFGLPVYTKWDLWTLLWVLYATFCLVKMMVMLVKAAIILLPGGRKHSLLSYRHRGCYFALLEHISHFYISLLTIRPWIAFITHINADEQQSSLFSGLLLIFYVLVKAYNLYKSLINLRRTVKEAVQSLPFPYASTGDLAAHASDPLCPICRCEYRDPIILTCKHLFCEECVTSWLDRNASCPLCRSKLAIRQANYRDGFTSGFLIWS